MDRNVERHLERIEEKLYAINALGRLLVEVGGGEEPPDWWGEYIHGGVRQAITSLAMSALDDHARIERALKGDT